jgi:hypothetical protein
MNGEICNLEIRKSGWAVRAPSQGGAFPRSPDSEWGNQEIRQRALAADAKMGIIFLIS